MFCVCCVRSVVLDCCCVCVGLLLFGVLGHVLFVCVCLQNVVGLCCRCVCYCVLLPFGVLCSVLFLPRVFANVVSCVDC